MPATHLRALTTALAVPLLGLSMLAMAACGDDDPARAVPAAGHRTTTTIESSTTTDSPTIAAPTRRDVAPPPGLQERLDAVVAAGVPGIAVLGRSGDSRFSSVAGLADRESGTPLTVDTRFRTGSVAKTVVATIALQLVDEGTISLDDTVERWMPGMVPNGGRITLRELLGNRSGLFDFAEDPQVLAPYLSGDVGHVWAPADLVAVSAAHDPNFAPDEGTLYSNTDYTLMGLVIERATGASLPDEAKRRIFDPLGLDHTSIPTTGALTGDVAHGYFIADAADASTKRDVTNVDPSVSSFGGNLVSTTADLATFFDALFGGNLISDAAMAEMQVVTTSTSGERLGLGLQQVDLPCGTFIGHSGSTPGYKATAFADLEHDRQFVALANSLTLDDAVGDQAANEAFEAAAVAAACG